jgi:hypothetical protein
MHMNLNYARHHWTKPGENPPLGLILCAEKGAEEARYATTDAFRAGLLNLPEASRIRRFITRFALEPSLSTQRNVQRGLLIRKESR